METVKLVTTFLLFSIASSATGQSVTGQVFSLGPEKQNCKAYGECDCCMSHLYFLDEKDFALVDYCECMKEISTGTYTFQSQTITLIFKQIVVSSGVSDCTDEKQTPVLNKNVVELKPLVFQTTKCENGSLMLLNEHNNYKFGLRTETNRNAASIAELKRSQEWELLQKH